MQGVRTPPPSDDLRFSNTTGNLQKKKKTLWFIGVEVEQETSAPPPKKNPGSTPEYLVHIIFIRCSGESNQIKMMIFFFRTALKSLPCKIN